MQPFTVEQEQRDKDRQRRYMTGVNLALLCIAVTAVLLLTSCSSSTPKPASPAGTGALAPGADTLSTLDRDALVWAGKTVTAYSRDSRLGWTAPVPMAPYALACGYEDVAPSGPGPLCTASQDAGAIEMLPVEVTGHRECTAVTVGTVRYVWCADRYRTALAG